MPNTALAKHKASKDAVVIQQPSVQTSHYNPAPVQGAVVAKEESHLGRNILIGTGVVAASLVAITGLVIFQTMCLLGS